MSVLEHQLERTLVARFLRRYTNLNQLAKLIEDGVHLRPEKEIRDYCALNKINVLP